MIISNTIELKKYVSVGQSFLFSEFEPYIDKAINTYIRKYVGNLHEQLDIVSDTDENKSIKISARMQLSSAVANFGMFIYFPLLQIDIDSSGASVPNNDNKKAAEWWQIKDARRELLRSGHEAMDLLLEILEKNPVVFTDYATDYSTINNELLVNKASVFSKYYNIFDSRQTFLAILPTLRVVQDQYITTFISSDLLVALKSTVTGVKLELKNNIQKAMVAFCIAKICNNGLFILDDRGLRIDFENLMDGRREQPSGKSILQIEKLASEQIANGTQYLKQSKLLIENNPFEFANFINPLLNSTTTNSDYKPFNSQGVLGI